MNCIIERTDEEVILRFPANTDYEAMKQHLDYLQFLDIVSKSQATQEDIDDVIQEAKHGIGKQTRNFLAGKPGFEHWKAEEE